MDKLKKIFKKDKEEPTSSTSSKPSSTSTAPPTQQSQQPTPQTGQPPVSGAGAKSKIEPENAEGVIMTTTLGDITIALFKDQCPRTCLNFATLAATGKYASVPFHRIIPSFMIQGGDPTGTGRGGSSIFGDKFEDEIVSGLRHTDKGTLSMANSGPNTNGSQFFITLAPTPHLDGKHTVFGHVVQGMEVVDKLGNVRTGQADKPVNKVEIIGCTIF